MQRDLTAEEQEFVATLTSALPPVIARKEVSRFLGGLVASKTLANADDSGEGPEVAYKVGRSVAYRTDSLIAWVVGRFGVERIPNVKAF